MEVEEGEVGCGGGYVGFIGMRRETALYEWLYNIESGKIPITRRIKKGYGHG